MMLGAAALLGAGWDLLRIEAGTMDPPDEVDGWPIMTPIGELPKPVEDGFVRHSTGRAWLIVFALNLPVCLHLGSAMTSDEGKLGMIAGIIVLYGVGGLVLRVARPFGIDLIVGGAVVLFSQFVPLAQVGAGMAGLWVSEILLRGVGVTFDRGLSGIPFSAALIATLVTGGLLINLAFVLGLISRPVTPAAWRRPDPGRAKPMVLAELRDF